MEMIPMDRCAMAYQYRKEGYNCAQAVAASFADLTGLTPETMMAAAKGFGGGVGGSFQELCGAVSGAVLVLGMLDPDVTETDRAGRKRVYPKAKALRDRFEETFGHIHCGDLRAARPGHSQGPQGVAQQRRGHAAAHQPIAALIGQKTVHASLHLTALLSAGQGRRTLSRLPRSAGLPKAPPLSPP